MNQPASRRSSGRSTTSNPGFPTRRTGRASRRRTFTCTGVSPTGSPFSDTCAPDGIDFTWTSCIRPRLKEQFHDSATTMPIASPKLHRRPAFASATSLPSAIRTVNPHLTTTTRRPRFCKLPTVEGLVVGKIRRHRATENSPQQGHQMGQVRHGIAAAARRPTHIVMRFAQPMPLAFENPCSRRCVSSRTEGEARRMVHGGQYSTSRRSEVKLHQHAASFMREKPLPRMPDTAHESLC